LRDRVVLAHRTGGLRTRAGCGLPTLMSADLQSTQPCTMSPLQACSAAYENSLQRPEVEDRYACVAEEAAV
jgi:hypothetical protein